MALLAQGRPTPSGLTVRDIVQFGRSPRCGRWSQADRHDPAAAQHALTLTDVEDLADRGAEHLSGGRLQRVWLASCLARVTSLLLEMRCLAHHSARQAARQQSRPLSAHHWRKPASDRTLRVITDEAQLLDVTMEALGCVHEALSGPDGMTILLWNRTAAAGTGSPSRPASWTVLQRWLAARHGRRPIRTSWSPKEQGLTESGLNCLSLPSCATSPMRINPLGFGDCGSHGDSSHPWL
ncbi:hypothetical protein M2156_000017 [Streptomyces sp. SAI-149]|nr:hypothetical protein [Streptomyces sp. SAI-149]